MTNAVSGTTNGGHLFLGQTATGGVGGASSGGLAGQGGKAASHLTFNDDQSATQSALVTGSSTAIGGVGGLGSDGSHSGKGGSAIAALNLTGGSLAASSNATGGDGGSSKSGAGGYGHATTTAVGSGNVQASAAAQGGEGGSDVGEATARLIVTGASGNYIASAGTGTLQPQLIEAVSAFASGSVSGKIQATALANIGGGAQLFNSVRQGNAFENGGPDSASTNAVLADNSAIATAFGTSSTFFAIGELGGAHSSAATGTQTTTLETDETVDLGKLASRGNLTVGFYNGAAVGGSVTGVTFDLYADGVDVVHESFASGAAAQTYFTDNAVDLGSLATGPLSGNTLTLKELLTVTSTAAGSGFYGQALVGDAPPANAMSNGAHHNLIQAMAAFGARAPAMSSPIRQAGPSAHLMLSAPHTQIA
jgi:hypothetical protein